ncbi:MAG: NDP-sugar synthase [Chlorobi bacterium]|nr:NDP-sugar synthase [Chlorobiota bacterium]
MMELAIIAAGEGSRLKTEGVSVSKPMVKINGTPMIKRIIDIAVKSGIKSANCIINENSIDLKRFLTNENFPIPVKVIVKTTQSSLHSLYELSKVISTPFLLTTSDSIFLENEFADFVSFAMDKTEADAVFAITDFVDDEKPLYVSVKENFEISGFHDENKGYEYVTGGLYLFKRNINREIEEAVNGGMERLRNFQRYLIKRDFKIDGYRFSKIIDVDHADDIKKAENFLFRNKVK